MKFLRRTVPNCPQLKPAVALSLLYRQYSATETSEIKCHHRVITERNDKSYVFELIEIAELVWAELLN